MLLIGVKLLYLNASYTIFRYAHCPADDSINYPMIFYLGLRANPICFL